jgi:hypothetical protein
MKYELNEFTSNEVISKLPHCAEAVRLLQSWQVTCLSPEGWLKANPVAARWAVKNGFISEVVKHDWSELILQKGRSGIVTLYDCDSNMALLSFCTDGEVRACKCADGGAGNFDTEGRLIIT